MIEDQAIKQCREILKKNNLHPLKKLGKGGFSLVFLVEKIQLKQTQNLLYSVKCINKRQFLKRPSLQKYIDQEVTTWRDLTHHNIVRLVRTFEDEGWIFMIMEYCNQGNLQQVQNTKEGKMFSLTETVRIVREIIDGLQYMHSKNLIHRDIKAENVMLTVNKSQKNSICVTKICDLGFCREDDDSVNTFCGTTNYMAPQIFEKKTYDLKVDIWALGVLMFCMLFGEFPFKGLNIYYEISNKCQNGFNLKAMKLKKNQSLSKRDFDLLNQLFSQIFRIDPSKRIGIPEILKYKYFTPEKSSRNTTGESDSEDENIFQNQRLSFMKHTLAQVKQAKFLTPIEEVSFRYYINKIIIISLEGRSKDERPSKKVYEQIINQNQQYQNILASNLKKNPIPQFIQIFKPKLKEFTQFKEAYRIVVGYVFAKAHKNMGQDFQLRSRLKLKLFCCHVINRVFQKQNRTDIFSHYYNWLRKEKKIVKFEFKSFQKWIQVEHPDKLVQTFQFMNDKFYKRSN